MFRIGFFLFTICPYPFLKFKWFSLNISANICSGLRQRSGHKLYIKWWSENQTGDQCTHGKNIWLVYIYVLKNESPRKIEVFLGTRRMGHFHIHTIVQSAPLSCPHERWSHLEHNCLLVTYNKAISIICSRLIIQLNNR